MDGSIFAMLVGGRLVVKLPEDRVAGLVAEGTGAPFEAGKGRPMREWLSVDVGAATTRQALAGEAYEFVREGGPPGRRARG